MQTDSEHMNLWNENIACLQTQDSISLVNFYPKMGDFDIMTQNSILVKFNMDFIIEIVNLEFLNKSENFIPYKKFW